MDLTAICLCRDHNVPLQVFDMNKAGALLSVVMGEKEELTLRTNVREPQSSLYYGLI